MWNNVEINLLLAQEFITTVGLVGEKYSINYVIPIKNVE